jgi:hypothetical protein
MDGERTQYSHRGVPGPFLRRKPRKTKKVALPIKNTIEHRNETRLSPLHFRLGAKVVRAASGASSGPFHPQRAKNRCTGDNLSPCSAPLARRNRNEVQTPHEELISDSSASRQRQREQA